MTIDEELAMLDAQERAIREREAAAQTMQTAPSAQVQPSAQGGRPMTIDEELAELDRQEREIRARMAAQNAPSPAPQTAQTSAPAPQSGLYPWEQNPGGMAQAQMQTAQTPAPIPQSAPAQDGVLPPSKEQGSPAAAWIKGAWKGFTDVLFNRDAAKEAVANIRDDARNGGFLDKAGAALTDFGALPFKGAGEAAGSLVRAAGNLTGSDALKSRADSIDQYIRDVFPADAWQTGKVDENGNPREQTMLERVAQTAKDVGNIGFKFGAAGLAGPGGVYSLLGAESVNRYNEVMDEYNAAKAAGQTDVSEGAARAAAVGASAVDLVANLVMMKSVAGGATKAITTDSFRKFIGAYAKQNMLNAAKNAGIMGANAAVQDATANYVMNGDFDFLKTGKALADGIIDGVLFEAVSKAKHVPIEWSASKARMRRVRDAADAARALGDAAVEVESERDISEDNRRTDIARSALEGLGMANFVSQSPDVAIDMVAARRRGENVDLGVLDRIPQELRPAFKEQGDLNAFADRLMEHQLESQQKMRDNAIAAKNARRANAQKAAMDNADAAARDAAYAEREQGIGDALAEAEAQMEANKGRGRKDEQRFQAKTENEREKFNAKADELDADRANAQDAAIAMEAENDAAEAAAREGDATSRFREAHGIKPYAEWLNGRPDTKVTRWTYNKLFEKAVRNAVAEGDPLGNKVRAEMERNATQGELALDFAASDKPAPQNAEKRPVDAPAPKTDNVQGEVRGERGGAETKPKTWGVEVPKDKRESDAWADETNVDNSGIEGQTAQRDELFSRAKKNRAPASDANPDYPVGTVVERDDGTRYVREEGEVTDYATGKTAPKWREVDGAKRAADQEHVFSSTRGGETKVVQAAEDAVSEPQKAQSAPDKQMRIISLSANEYKRLPKARFVKDENGKSKLIWEYPKKQNPKPPAQPEKVGADRFANAAPDETGVDSQTAQRDALFAKAKASRAPEPSPAEPAPAAPAKSAFSRMMDALRNGDAEAGRAAEGEFRAEMESGRFPTDAEFDAATEGLSDAAKEKLRGVVQWYRDNAKGATAAEEPKKVGLDWIRGAEDSTGAEEQMARMREVFEEARAKREKPAPANGKVGDQFKVASERVSADGEPTDYNRSGAVFAERQPVTVDGKKVGMVEHYVDGRLRELAGQSSDVNEYMLFFDGSRFGSHRAVEELVGTRPEDGEGAYSVLTFGTEKEMLDAYDKLNAIHPEAFDTNANWGDAEWSPSGVDLVGIKRAFYNAARGDGKKGSKEYDIKKGLPILNKLSPEELDDIAWWYRIGKDGKSKEDSPFGVAVLKAIAMKRKPAAAKTEREAKTTGSGDAAKPTGNATGKITFGTIAEKLSKVIMGNDKVDLDAAKEQIRNTILNEKFGNAYDDVRYLRKLGLSNEDAEFVLREWMKRHAEETKSALSDLERENEEAKTAWMQNRDSDVARGVDEKIIKLRYGGAEAQDRKNAELLADLRRIADEAMPVAEPAPAPTAADPRESAYQTWLASQKPRNGKPKRDSRAMRMQYEKYVKEGKVDAETGKTPSSSEAIAKDAQNNGTLSQKIRAAQDEIRSLQSQMDDLLRHRDPDDESKEDKAYFDEREDAIDSRIAEIKAEIEAMRKPSVPFQPFTGKANPKKAAGVVGEFVYKQNDKTPRRALAKVNHDKKNGVVVATDGRILIATKHGFNPNGEDDPAFPNWTRLVPNEKDTPLSVTVNPTELAKTCKNILRLARATGTDLGDDYSAPKIALRFGDRIRLFNAEYMLKLANAMEANGIAELKTSGFDGNPVVARNADTTMLVMPFRGGSDNVISPIGRGEHSLIVNGHNGRIISAPERTDTSLANSRNRSTIEKRTAAEGEIEELIMRTQEARDFLSIKSKKKGGVSANGNADDPSTPTDAGFRAWLGDIRLAPNEEAQNRRTFEMMVRAGKVDGATGENIVAAAKPANTPKDETRNAPAPAKETASAAKEQVPNAEPAPAPKTVAAPRVAADLRSMRRGDQVLVDGLADNQKATFLKDNGDGTAQVQVRTTDKANPYASPRAETRTVKAEDIRGTGIGKRFRIDANGKEMYDEATPEETEKANRAAGPAFARVAKEIGDVFAGTGADAEGRRARLEGVDGPSGKVRGLREAVDAANAVLPADQRVAWVGNVAKYLDDAESLPIANGTRRLSGMESTVVRRADGKIVKAVWINDANGYTIPQALNKISAYNALFGDRAPMKCIGFGEGIGGKTYAIFEQKFVDGGRHIADGDASVEGYLRSIDPTFRKLDPEGTAYESDRFFVSDLHARNMLKGDNGEVNIIDANVFFKNSPEGRDAMRRHRIESGSPTVADAEGATPEMVDRLAERMRKFIPGVKVDVGELSDGAKASGASAEYDRGTNTARLRPDATLEDAFHELGGHGVWQWAEQHCPELLRRAVDYAKGAPKELRERIFRDYGEFDGKALVEELFSHRVESEGVKAFMRLERGEGAETGAERKWAVNLANAVRAVFQSAAKRNGVDLERLRGKGTEEFVRGVLDQMVAGRDLNEWTAYGKDAKWFGKDVGMRGTRGDERRDRIPSVPSVAPEEDAAYMDAVKRGDMETAQRMVREAAAKAGYKTAGFHGTDAEFNRFKTRSKFSVTGLLPIFLSKDISTASSYGKRVISTLVKMDNPAVVDCRSSDALSIKNDGMLTQEDVDAVNSKWDNPNKKRVYDSFSTNQIAYAMRLRGNDGVVFNNVKDSYSGNNKSTVYAIFDGKNVKSADPVTFDDAGSPIPLSERFRTDHEGADAWKNSDIRYRRPKYDEETEDGRRYNEKYADARIAQTGRGDLGGVGDAVEKAYSAVRGAPGEAGDVLLRNARENGFYRGMVEEGEKRYRRELFGDGEAEKRGMETIHVYREGKDVIKYLRPEATVGADLEKVRRHNALFGDRTPYSLEGVSELPSGEASMVLRQPYIDFVKGGGDEARRQLAEDLRRRFGKVEVLDGGREMRAGEWWIDDLKDDNIGIDAKTGRYAVIDALIHNAKDFPDGTFPKAEGAEGERGKATVIGPRNDGGEVGRLTGEEIGRMVDERNAEGSVYGDSDIRYRRAGTPVPAGVPARKRYMDRDLSKAELAKESYMRNFADRYHPVKTMMVEAKMAEGMSKKDAENWAANDAASPYNAKRRQSGFAEHDLTGVRAIRDNAVDIVDKELKRAGLDSKDFDTWAWAAHAKDRNRQKLADHGIADGAGISDADADSILNGTAKVTAFGKERVYNATQRSALEKARKAVVHELNGKYGIEYLRKAGLIDAEQARRLLSTYGKDYVCLADDMGEDGVDYNRPASVASPLRKASGRTTAMEDSPIVQTILGAMQNVVNAKKNMAAANLADFVENHPEMGVVRAMTPVDTLKPNEVTFRRNVTDKKTGREVNKRFVIELYGKRGIEMAQSFTDAKVVRGPQWMQGLTRAWAAFATQLSPTFTVRNYLKDTMEVTQDILGTQGIGAAAKFLGDQIRSNPLHNREFRGLVREFKTTGTIDLAKHPNSQTAREFKEFIESGSLIGGLGREGYAENEKMLKDAAKGFDGAKGAMRKAAALFKGYTDIVGAMNENIEMLTRFNNYRTRRTGENGVWGGKGAESIDEAAMNSREGSTDFGMYGNNRWMNSVWMFSNSILGGTMRSMKTLAFGKNGRRLAVALVAAGFLEEAANSLLNDDEDAEKKGDATEKDVMEYDRENSFRLRVGGKTLKVPIHFSPFALLKYAGNQAFLASSGRISAEQAGKNVLGAVAKVGSHFSGTGEHGIGKGEPSLIASLTPTAIAQPMVQIAMNQDYKGDPIHKEHSLGAAKHTPDWVYAKKGTNPLWTEISRALNKMPLSGGSDLVKGRMSIPPEDIAYFTKQVFKNFGTDVVNAALETPMAAYKTATTGENAFTTKNIPFVRDVVKDSTDVAQRYYEVADAHAREHNAWNLAKGKDKREYLRGHPTAGYNLAKIEDSVKRLQALARGEVLGKDGKVVSRRELTSAQKEAYEKRARAQMANYIRIVEGRKR